MSQKVYVDNNIEHANDDRVYYYNLPHLVIGSITSFNKTVKVFDPVTHKIVDKEIMYSQAITKQIDEAVQNSIDENNRTHGDYANKIYVYIDQEEGLITCSDNGRGLPIDKYVLASTQFKTSSNFKFMNNKDQNAQNQNIGAHGIGNKIIPLFSSWYQLTTVTLNGERGILECTNNMQNIVHKEDTAPKSAKHGVTIKFKPDFEYMGIEKQDGKYISDDLVNHIHAVLVNISIAKPNIEFYFQGRLIKVNDFKDFIKYYSDNYVILEENEKMNLAVIPSEGYSFVNVINTLDLNKGSVALDYYAKNIVDKYTERLRKGYSKISPSHVKNNIGIILILKNMVNLRYGGGQTKDEVKNTVTELGLPTLNYAEYAEKLFKNKNISGPIIELYRIQQEMEKRKALGSLKAEEKEKFNPKLVKATDVNEYLMVAEGDSATSSLPEAFGRRNIGYLPLMGKLMNSLKSKPDAIKKNKRAEDLIEAFGIGLGNSRYEKIIAATDADLDGTHIKTLMIAMFYVLDRKVLEEQRFYQLNTPVMVITDKNDNLIKWYYTLSEYQEDQPNIKPGYTHMYIKGLGSLSSKNLKKIIEKDGIEKMIEPIVFDVEKDGKIIERWMTDEGIDYRKMVLEQKSFDISNI